EARFGLKDENGHLYPQPLIEDLLGIVYDHTVPTPSGFLDSLERKPKRPQVITKKIGKGKVVYANFSLFLAIRNKKKKWLNRVRKELRKR
ncbi:MAG: hypothetical protein PHH60_04030, partial [Candidatus Margulisbacteria bacterium]|nr:hypothetical protein [Candidatus Margulisiibacteriota bacterium]